MTKAYRGPMVLTIAGFLLIFAIGAYLIGDLESNSRRQEMFRLDQEMLRDYRVWSLEIHAELQHQRAATADTRRRLDDLNRRLATMHEELESLKSNRARPTPLGKPDDGNWPMASGK